MLYNTYDYSDSYYLYDFRKESMQFIGNYNDFIKFLAKGYEIRWLPDECGWYDWREYNKYLTYYTCDVNESYPNMRYFLFMRDKSVINPSIYQEEVKKCAEAMQLEAKTMYGVGWHKPLYYFKYRKGPVPNTACYRGGCSQKSARVKSILISKTDPEYKEFHRTFKSRKRPVPVCWDDRFRRPQRSWKEQRKTQYKEKN
jgi:hypothetical protein